MSAQVYNVAVIGYGLSAKVFHIPFILALPDHFRLYAIVQRSPGGGNNAAEDHPDVRSYRQFEQAIGDENVDVIVISSIPETHFSMCKAALEAKKHVVVEKPFVPTSQEADELVNIARKSGKVLAVYQNRRWDSDFLTLRDVLATSALGDLAEFETHMDRHRPDPPPATWKADDAPGHGSIYDLGTHLIDQVYHLFGLPKRVTGFVGNQRRSVNGGAPDSHTVLLHYDFLLVTVKAGVISPESKQLRYWVRGAKGSFKKYHVDPQEDQLKDQPQGAKLPADYGVEPESHWGVLTLWEDGKPVEKIWPAASPPVTYVDYYRTLAQALRGSGPTPVSGEDARDVLRIIEAALKSSKEGRTVEL